MARPVCRVEDALESRLSFSRSASTRGHRARACENRAATWSGREALGGVRKVGNLEHRFLPVDERK